MQSGGVLLSLLALWTCTRAASVPPATIEELLGQLGPRRDIDWKSLLQENTQAEDEPQIWALLVAGSSEWYNYRHQADVCHAYQVLHNHGIPDDRIVVMMYDDIANNTENPTPGKVINHPKGPDVYHGVPKDYTKDDVTPENFLKILQGEDMTGIGSGKVLRSGPNDHVFVYFTDHGAEGIIAFPNGDELSATDLNKAIKKMHQETKYKKMVFYIEACESGSMFENLLPHNINVFATTASNAEESSYACYFDDTLSTYLGDCYSVNWMEDSDKEDLQKETLSKQFKIVKKETTTSHVMEYGDLTMGSMHLSEFQGPKEPKVRLTYPEVPKDAVPGPDVPLAILKRKIDKATNPDEKFALEKQLRKLMRYRDFMDNVMRSLIHVVAESNDKERSYIGDRRSLTDYDCYYQAVRYFKQECFSFKKNPYALRQLYILANFCEDNISLGHIKQAIDHVCIHPPVEGIL